MPNERATINLSAARAGGRCGDEWLDFATRRMLRAEILLQIAHELADHLLTRCPGTHQPINIGLEKVVESPSCLRHPIIDLGRERDENRIRFHRVDRFQLRGLPELFCKESG